MNILAFDSGIGGLTALVPILQKHPGTIVSYLGDLAHLPYGTKSPERIRRLCAAASEWLLAPERRHPSGKDWCLVACNTASAHALDVFESAAAASHTKVSGVIVPGCRKALSLGSARIVVLATGATVSSQAYPRTLRTLGYTGEIVQQACPLFVPLVEDDLLRGPEVQGLVRRYLDSVLRPGDAVVLGCTHYPLLLPQLREMYADVAWIDAGHSLLEMDPHPALGQASVPPRRRTLLQLYVTDDVSSAERARRFLSSMGLTDIDLEVKSIAPLV